MGCCSLLQGNLHKPGIEPRSSALQPDSLPAEPRGKPKNTGVGGLSLLQRIFLTQELNQGLLHCRQILYQLSYQGSLLLVYRSAINVNFLLLILASVGGTCLQLLLWCLSLYRYKLRTERALVTHVFENITWIILPVSLPGGLWESF